MTGNDVIEVVVWLNAADITLWIDGGWGIDALVGEQTRPHDDLDIVIDLEQNTDAIATLSCHDFLLHHDGRPVSFIMRDEHDRQVDFHPVRFDAEVPVGRLYRTAASSATRPKVSAEPELSPASPSAASPPNSRSSPTSATTRTPATSTTCTCFVTAWESRSRRHTIDSALSCGRLTLAKQQEEQPDG